MTMDDFVSGKKPPMVLGTRSHHLAMFVVYLSPLQMVADWPGAYRGAAGSEFLKTVPASWDETLPLAGEIGDYVVVARRKGNDWFLGGMTDNTPREIEISTSFLDNEKGYQAIIYQDTPNSGENPTELEVVQRDFTATDSLTIKMAAGGGIAVYLKRK